MKPIHWMVAGAGATLALLAYGTLVEPRWLQVRRVRIHVRTLPPDLEGLRVGLVSDVHLRAGRSPGLARRAAAALDRAAPDLIAITGDLAEDEPGLDAVLDAFHSLSAPLGVFVVPGNHDHKAGIHRWRRAIARNPSLTDLTTRFRTARRGGATLCIAGMDDHIEGHPSLRLPPPGARDLTIVLAHSPDQAEQCRRRYDAVDLILSGHTHGGQIRIPFLGAPVTSARRADLYDQGLRRRPWTQVYISRGLGTSRLPIRFLARPEVAIIELTRRPRPRRPNARRPRHRRARRPASLEFRRRDAHIPQPGLQAKPHNPNPRGAHENP
jgi:uncharacterized protein